MAHAIGLRATSFAASATLVGFTLVALLTMNIVQRVVAPSEERQPFVTIVAPDPPPPDEARPRDPEPPPVRPTEGDPILPFEPPPQTLVRIAELGPPAPIDTIPTIVNPQWVRRPSDLARYYPERALRREIEGRVLLDCGVSVSGALDCAVVSETPANWGFGQAALRISRDYQMVPARRDGVPVEARHRMVVPFEIR